MCSSATPPWLVFVGKRDADGVGRSSCPMKKTWNRGRRWCCRTSSSRQRTNVDVQRTDVVVIGQYVTLLAITLADFYPVVRLLASYGHLSVCDAAQGPCKG